jgi:putative oxidoreductase
VSYGILLLRLVLGLTVAAHGAQKLFGAFGGSGPGGTARNFDRLGFRPPLLMALGAGLAEFGGGLLFAGGLLTPLAALAIAVVMVNAVVTTHLANGFWNSRGGYEYNLLVWTAAVAVSATGAARFSFDRLLGIDDNISGLWWGVAVVALSIVVSAGTLVLGRRHDRDQTTRAAVESEGLDKAA